MKRLKKWEFPIRQSRMWPGSLRLSRSQAPRDLPVPLAWLSGSEAQLRLLTRAICHTELDLFAEQGFVTVHYRLGTSRKRGAFLSIMQPESGLNATWKPERPYLSGRTTSLCALAFRLNPGVGSRWARSGGHPADGLEMQIEAIRLVVKVEAPSAHDRAEAMITLIDYLDDKLHRPEKRAWVGLPPL